MGKNDIETIINESKKNNIRKSKKNEHLIK